MSSLSSNTTAHGVSADSTSTNYILNAAVDAAVWWWGDFLKKSSLSIEIVKKFEEVLKELIVLKISDHWYPELPTKGQAYRSLSVDKKAHIDPILSKAANSVGLDNFMNYFNKLDSVLMWVDPDVVLVRIAYTGYASVPPEDKVLYRSNIGANLKVVSSKTLKTNTPPPIIRPGILRTSPPGSPANSISDNHQNYLGSFRSSSPGLNSNAAQYYPSSIHYSQYSKPAYIPAQRHPNLVYNNLFSQTQYMPWHNPNTAYSENWNEHPVTISSNRQPQPAQTNSTHPKLYIDYLTDSVLPLEAQA
jgi:hypothetical protein